MDNPLVSVIIPTRNRKEYVTKAISSVLGQTFKDLEIIVIDDFSSDGTYKIISEISEKLLNVVVVRNEENRGFVKTLNKGILMAKGKYIARLDDDDIWSDPEKLFKQLSFLEKNPEYVLVGGGVINIDPQNGKEIVRFLLPEADADIRKLILISNVFAHSTVIFKKDDWERVGQYDEDFGFFADWDLWLKLGKLGKFYNFQDYFIRYSDQDFASRGAAHDRSIRRKLITNIKLRGKYRGFYPRYFKAIIVCFANYFYSFIPLKNKLWPAIFQVRNLILGPSPYKYSNYKNTDAKK